MSEEQVESARVLMQAHTFEEVCAVSNAGATFYLWCGQAIDEWDELHSQKKPAPREPAPRPVPKYAKIRLIEQYVAYMISEILNGEFNRSLKRIQRKNVKNHLVYEQAKSVKTQKFLEILIDI